MLLVAYCKRKCGVLIREMVALVYLVLGLCSRGVELRETGGRWDIGAHKGTGMAGSACLGELVQNAGKAR